MPEKLRVGLKKHIILTPDLNELGGGSSSFFFSHSFKTYIGRRSSVVGLNKSSIINGK